MFLTLLTTLTVLHAQEYSRKSFSHWIDVDRDCQNTRQEILIERSLVPVSFTNKKNCTVSSGKWNDFYFEEVLTDASKVDIDHVVPLKHAWEAGAKKWNSYRRKEFANDSENLVITNRQYNRQKGAKSLTEWMPVNRNYACRYAKQWFLIKNKYTLTINDEERKSFALLKCDQLQNDKNQTAKSSDKSKNHSK